MSWFRRKDGKSKKGGKGKGKSSSLPPGASLPPEPDETAVGEPSPVAKLTTLPSTPPDRSARHPSDSPQPARAATASPLKKGSKTPSSRGGTPKGSPKEPRKSPGGSPRKARASGGTREGMLSPRTAAEARSPAPAPIAHEDPHPTIVLEASPQRGSPAVSASASATPDSGHSTASTLRTSDGDGSPRGTPSDSLDAASPMATPGSHGGSASGTATPLQPVGAGERGGVSPDKSPNARGKATPGLLEVSQGSGSPVVGSPVHRVMTTADASPSPPGAPSGPPTARLFVSGVRVKRVADDGVNPEGPGAAGEGVPPPDDGGYVQVDGVSDEEDAANANGNGHEGSDGSSPLRHILSGSIATLKRESVGLIVNELETEIAVLNTSFPAIAQNNKGANRLSAAETIAVYLTEKRLASSNNPFEAELREFQSQVDIFRMCSEPMLEQFKMYVDAEETAALEEVTARYDEERVKIQRLLKAAEIATAASPVASPDPTAAAPDSPFAGSPTPPPGNVGSDDGGATPEPSEDVDAATPTTSPTLALPTQPAAALGEAREGGGEKDVTPESGLEEEYNDATVCVSDMPAARALYGDGPASTTPTTPSTAASTGGATGEGAALPDPDEYSDTVRIVDMAAAREAYGAASGDAPSGGDAATTASAAAGQPAAVALDPSAFSDSVRVHDMEAARLIYGAEAVEAATTGGSGEGVGAEDAGQGEGEGEAVSPTSQAPRGVLLSEVWNSDTGEHELRVTPTSSPAPESKYDRKNRPRTIWVKPGTESPAKNVRGSASPSSPLAPPPVAEEVGGGLEEELEIEEDIPEEIAPTKKSGWVREQSRTEVRKGTI